MKVLKLCTDCKNLAFWSDVKVYECTEERHKELRDALLNDMFTDCEYWESRV